MDESEAKKYKLHLISSIVYSEEIFSVPDLGERLASWGVDLYYIFVIHANKRNMEKSKEKIRFSAVYSKRVIWLEIDVEEFISRLSNPTLDGQVDTNMFSHIESGQKKISPFVIRV